MTFVYSHPRPPSRTNLFVYSILLRPGYCRHNNETCGAMDRQFTSAAALASSSSNNITLYVCCATLSLKFGLQRSHPLTLTHVRALLGRCYSVYIRHSVSTLVRFEVPRGLIANTRVLSVSSVKVGAKAGVIKTSQPRRIPRDS